MAAIKVDLANKIKQEKNLAESKTGSLAGISMVLTLNFCKNLQCGIPKLSKRSV